MVRLHFKNRLKLLQPCLPGTYCPWSGQTESALECDGGFACTNEYFGSWSPRAYCNEDLEDTQFCSRQIFGDICPPGTACPVNTQSIENIACPENRFCPYPGLDTEDLTQTAFQCAAGYKCVSSLQTTGAQE